MRPARILILRGGAIGDFIVTLPVISALRERWPDGHLELIGYPHAGRLAMEAGLINRFRSLDEARVARLFAWNMVVDEHDQQYFASFDIVINFLHDPGDTLPENLKRLGVRLLINGSPMVESRHATEHFLKPLESLAIYGADDKPALEIAQKPVASPIDAGTSWIALHPGSGGISKNWPIACFLELAEKISAETACRPVFITGDAERAYIPEIDQLLAPYPRMHNMDLAHLASLLKQARAFIGNDGGISHLAAAAGCPTLALFGPTNPSLWAPRGQQVTIVESPDKSMASIPVAKVMDELCRVLGIERM